MTIPLGALVSIRIETYDRHDAAQVNLSGKCLLYVVGYDPLRQYYELALRPILPPKVDSKLALEWLNYEAVVSYYFADIPPEQLKATGKCATLSPDIYTFLGITR